MAQPFALMVLLSFSLFITSALMLHVHDFHDRNTVATYPIKTFCAIPVLRHILLSLESLLPTPLVYLNVYFSSWNKGKPTHFVKGFVGCLTAVDLHSWNKSNR